MLKAYKYQVMRLPQCDSPTHRHSESPSTHRDNADTFLSSKTMQGVAAGLHSGAFYVGRSELLGWLNDTLDLNYQKIEQVSNGTPLPHTHNTTHHTHTTPSPSTWRGIAQKF